jgi:hypothetical protein
MTDPTGVNVTTHPELRDRFERWARSVLPFCRLDPPSASG